MIRTAPSINKTCYLIFKRQLQLNFRDNMSLLGAIIFLFLSICVFHIAIGHHNLAQTTALGILLVCIIFSLTLAYPRLVEDDYYDGNWEQFYLTGIPLELILLSKIMAQTLCYLFIFCLISPLCFIMLALDWQIFWQLLITVSLLICLNCFNIVFAMALSLGSRHVFLSSLLFLPLAIPSVIIAAMALQTASYLLILLALLIMLSPIFLISGAAALKQAIAYD